MSEYTQVTDSETQQAPAAPQQVVYVEKPKNGLGTAALVLGILAMVFAFLPFLNVISYVLAVIAIGLAIGGIVRAKKVNVGMVKTVIGAVLAVAALGTATMVNAATVAVVDEGLTAVEESLDATDEISTSFGTVSTNALDWSEVPVTVTNTSDETQTFIVTIVAESADGSEQYDSAYITVSDLEPGQSSTETASFTTQLPSDAVLSVSDAM